LVSACQNKFDDPDYHLSPDIAYSLKFKFMLLDHIFNFWILLAKADFHKKTDSYQQQRNLFLKGCALKHLHILKYNIKLLKK